MADKCRIGSGPENEWYFFSHKDKKYPTGSRTNRATTAGFWKATGRDKSIHLNLNRIGMRKTLVFYTGRAPHGQKTDWIMHEYRLEDDTNHNNSHLHEDGWVVCRVFKKKNQRCFQPQLVSQEEDHEHEHEHDQVTHHHLLQPLYNNDYTFDASMHLPQLFSPESSSAPPLSFMNNVDIECSHNLLRLTSSSSSSLPLPQERLNGGDWSFLDKLLASQHNHLDLKSSSQVHVLPFPSLI